MTRRKQNLVDNRIERIYRQACCGVQIPVLEIMRVFEVGRAVAATDASDDELRAAIVAFVDTIKVGR